jgi:pilus assembly protein Flp/PilA
MMASEGAERALSPKEMGVQYMSPRHIVHRWDAGQGLVEYALIIALIAVVVIGTLILLGPQIASIFQNISNNL